jgi:hypothetical protein
LTARGRGLLGAGVAVGLTVVLLRATACPSPTGAHAEGVVFESNWSTDTGTSREAVTDGKRWGNYWEFNRGTGVQLLSVVPGGPGGRNALRVIQRGPTFAANLQQNNVVPPSKGFYVRFYMRNDDTSSAGDHVVTVDTWKYGNLTFLRKWNASNGWRFVVSLYGCGFTYPIGHWGPDAVLQRGVWYRFEYFVDFVAATDVQVHPRVYDASGTQILSDADFQQSDFGNALWEGRNDWTLASYYKAGHSFCVDPAALRNFGLGNNGQAGALDTGLPWYFAGVQIRTDWWPGP